MIATFDVDQPSCIGCGTCWITNPQHFREHQVGDEYRATPTGQSVQDQASLRLAAEGCPSRSIHLFDADGQMIYPTAEQWAERERQAAW